MKVLFPGRFQPFHAGHQEVVRQLLEGGDDVIIGIRDTDINEQNPYTAEARMQAIKYLYAKEPRVSVRVIPDFDWIAAGRDPGWWLAYVEVDEEIANIRARDLRQ